MQSNGIINENDLMSRLSKSREILNMVEKKDYQPDLSKIQPLTNESRVNKINKTNLPDEIKKLMIEKPIEVVKLGQDHIGLEKLEKSKQLMEGGERVKVTQPTQNQSALLNEDFIQLLESMIRRVIDEKLDETKVTKIDEQLMLKVGDSVFKGKITGVKSK